MALTEKPTPLVLDFKTQAAFENLPRHLQKKYLDSKIVPEENRKIVVDFLYDIITKDNAMPSTQLMYAKHLLYLMKSAKHKPIREITKDDLMGYLHSLRKSPGLDPKQKWIRTHNTRAAMYMKFFKWLAFPELSSAERKHKELDMLKDVTLYKLKERTNVQAQDLWMPQEDAIFLSYCEDKRIQFYHMLSLDTSARPGEILRLRVGDIKIKYAGDKMYGEVEVGRGGKTKSRTVPLIIALPYYKALLAEHPEASNPKAYLFRSNEKKALFRNRAIQPHSLAEIYRRLKKRDFPKLLERPDISPEEKMKIQDMLQRPWNPYLRRHIGLTEKAKVLKEYTLRIYAGWTKTSKMPEVYLHDLGGESVAPILEAAGLKPSESLTMNVLQPKPCWNCKEPNRPSDQYCMKCNYALDFKAAIKAKEEQEEDTRRIAREEAMEAFTQLSKFKAKDIQDMLKLMDKVKGDNDNT